MLKLHTEGEANQVNYKYKKNLRRTKKKEMKQLNT